MNRNVDALNRSERYRILSGAITPRPIAFVSSQRPDGARNLAPFSFFNGVGVEPMMLMFSPLTTGAGEDKDTLRNVSMPDEGGTGEFVVNLVDEALVRAMSAAAESLPYGESEFDLAGLTEAKSAVVGPPRVAEAPVSFECVTRQIIRTGPGLPLSGNLVLGEVVHVWVRDELLDAALHVDQDALATVGRLGGAVYTTTRDRFPLVRGREALQAELPFVPRGQRPAKSSDRGG
ncbi:MAG: flavin reductase family protein [Deltaproteobacteria bacterium]|nr:flavin reductase family protein [Deltaproteobacteria bacterium]